MTSRLIGLRRVLAIAVFAYLTLDVTNPFVPGVFTFDPDESVDGYHASRHRTASSVVRPLSLRPTVGPVGRVAPARPEQRPTPAATVPPLTRGIHCGHPTARSDSGSSTDDH